MVLKNCKLYFFFFFNILFLFFSSYFFKININFIFFIHVTVAWFSFSFFIFIFIFTMYTQFKKSINFYFFIYGLLVCLLFSSLITLFTGILWGSAVWGSFWFYDSRLLFVFLMVIYSLLILFFYFKNNFYFFIIVSIGSFFFFFFKYTLNWWFSLHQETTLHLINLTEFINFLDMFFYIYLFFFNIIFIKIFQIIYFNCKNYIYLIYRISFFNLFPNMQKINNLFFYFNFNKFAMDIKFNKKNSQISYNYTFIKFLKLMMQYNFIKNYTIKNNNIIVTFKFRGNTNIIKNIKLITKPSKPVNVSASFISNKNNVYNYFILYSFNNFYCKTTKFQHNDNKEGGLLFCMIQI